MTDAGIGRYVRSAFKPHVTLLRDDTYITSRPVAPVSWTVGELMLVDSLVGQSRYVVHGRWPLQSRQLSFGEW
jgi:RNA 2',3'-cyclic 3'-phosphodiesterase